MAKINGYEELIFSNIVSDNDDAERLVKRLQDLANASANIEYGSRSLVKKFSIESKEYEKEEKEARQELLAFACSRSGIKKLETKADIVRAFDNSTFTNVLNSIISETLTGVVTNTDGGGIISVLCNIDTVDIGDSKTYEIDPKGLPIAQRSSYMSNVSFLDGFTKTPITVTPKVYTLGSSIDYIRILANGFDIGKEMARVAMGILYAQYKLVVGLAFDSANVLGTPFYQPTFDPAKYVDMITDLQATNKARTKAFGALTAFNKQGSVATTNFGFQAQDEMIRSGKLGEAYGVENMVLDQATDLSSPFIDANIDSLLLLPRNKILLLSDMGDKPIKLVRENLVRVLSKEANAGSLYRQSYTYTMSFDAGLATQGHYGLQTV